MSAPEPRCHVFGDFRIDGVARQLSRLDGAPVALTARVFDTLLYLVRHPGVSLGKDELLAGIWPGRVVEENNLTQSISTLRKVLGQEADGQRYIITEPGRGYRFVADVRVASLEAIAPPATVAHAADGFAVEPVSMTTGTLRRSRWLALSPRALVVASLVLIALAALAAWVVRPPANTGALVTPITTIAVLPFKPLSTDDRDEVLELGMADTLIAKLSSNRHLVVRSLGSVRKFSGLEQDPLAAGRELVVGAVLEGQVQRRADHVHVTARLLSVPGGAALWAGTFDENFTDVFTVQDAIAEKAATALAQTFDRDEQHAMRAGYTRNSDAYLLYLQGRYRIGKVTPTEIRAGMESFRKAIDLDPTFALAYAALAEGYRRLPMTSDVDPKEAFPLAKAAAKKALEIDDALADAHSVLGWVAFWYDWDCPASEKEFRRAIALNPSVMEAHLGYAHLLSNTGRDKEALAEGLRARELDPLSPLANTISAGFLASAHRMDEAQALLKRVLEIDPDFWVAHMLRGGFALGAKDYPAAISEFRRARDASDGSMQAVSLLAYALAKSGDRAGAQVLLDEALHPAGDRFVPASGIATMYIALDDNEQAIAWLNRAYEQRDVRMAFLRVDHRWDPIRTDPRFVALVDRVAVK
ncbi:MAG: winged helix-turn-helix domain-containing protein [Dokdonella sp.]